MEEARNTPLKVKRGRRIYEASRLRKTLARYYTERRKLYAEDFPDFYDADLRVIFGNGEPNGESAAKVMRHNRAGADRIDCPLDRTAQIHREHAGAQTDCSAARN